LTLWQGLWKLPGPVHDGGNLDQFPTHPIDDSIVFEDEFPEVLPPILRDNPARLWKFAQIIYMSDDALNE